MWCKDPFLGLLESSGFSVVRLPRRDFSPLQLLSSQKKELFKLGYLTASRPMPEGQLIGGAPSGTRSVAQ